MYKENRQKSGLQYEALTPPRGTGGVLPTTSATGGYSRVLVRPSVIAMTALASVAGVAGGATSDAAGDAGDTPNTTSGDNGNNPTTTNTTMKFHQ